MDEVLCSINKKHILNNPKTLQCNNTACLSCLQKIASYNGKLKCIFCNLEHDIKSQNIDFKNDDDDSIESLVRKNLNQLCRRFLADLNLGIRRLGERQENYESSFENYIEFLDGEIELRIESIKIEIDDLKDKLLKKVDFLVEKYKENSTQLENLVDLTIKTSSKDESVKAINKLNFDLKNFEKDFANYTIRSYLLSKCEFFGFLRGPYLNPDKLKNADPVIIDLKKQVSSLCAMCPLSDKQIAISDFKKNEIYVFDENFKKFERINYVQGFRIKSYYGICTSDDYESVYMCDLEYHRILITNSKFDFIKKVILKADSVIDEFACARDVCFYSNYFFILDQGYKSVFMFNKDGDFIKMLSLNSDIENPIDISACDNRIAVSDYKKSVLIYDFNGSLIDVVTQSKITSFCMKYGYLLTHGENGSVCCYKEINGNKFSKVSEFNSVCLKQRSESMTIFNDKLVISMGWAKSLAVIIIS